MPGEPPNPYAPGTTVDVEPEKAPAPSSPARWLGVLAALLIPIPMGVGLYVLGRQRRFIVWMTIGLAAVAFFLGAALSAHGKLCLLAMAVLVATWLAAALDALLARAAPSFPRFGQALAVAVGSFVASRVVAAALRLWVIVAFQIPSGAMSPSLIVGDHVFVRRTHTAFEPGDAIAFKYPLDPTTDYLKRVVAVAGDVVEMRGDVVSVNGRDLPQQAVDERCPPPDDQAGCKVLRERDGRRSYLIMLTDSDARDFPPTTVPPGKVFVLGDNRHNSSDSRVWGFVPLENIKGVVSFIWWSRASQHTGRPRDRLGPLRWERIGKRPTSD
jgi:signal peptidase I